MASFLGDIYDLGIMLEGSALVYKPFLLRLYFVDRPVDNRFPSGLKIELREVLSANCHSGVGRGLKKSCRIICCHYQSKNISICVTTEFCPLELKY